MVGDFDVRIAIKTFSKNCIVELPKRNLITYITDYELI